MMQQATTDEKLALSGLAALALLSAVPSAGRALIGFAAQVAETIAALAAQV